MFKLLQKRETPLHKAVATLVDPTIVVTLLTDRKACVNAVQTNDLTPLHFAAIRCLPDIVRFLVGNGANIHTPGLVHGCIIQSLNGPKKSETIGTLLELGINRDDIRYRCVVVVRLLLSIVRLR